MLAEIDLLRVAIPALIQRTGETTHTSEESDSMEKAAAFTASLQQAYQHTQVGNHTASLSLLQPWDDSPSLPPEAGAGQILLAVNLAHSGRLVEAEKVFQRALATSFPSDQKTLRAVTLHNLACCVWVPRGKFHLALSYGEQASFLFTQAGISHWGFPALQTLVYLTLGDRRQARNRLLEMVDEVEPATRTASIYYYLWARLALDDQELDKAKEYLRLGLRITTQNGNPDLDIILRIEQSRYYRKIGKSSLAMEWAEEAFRHAQERKIPYYIGQAAVEVAQVWHENQESARAFEMLEYASELFASLNCEYELARATYLAALWKFQHRHPQAEQAWRLAAQAISRGGYAFLLEKDQERAFHLVSSWSRSGAPETRQISGQILHALANVPPPPLRIATLGRFAVWKGSIPIPSKAWLRRRAGELFRFLLLQPERKAGKEVVLEALWPEHDERSAADLLHQSTSALRHILEPDLPEKLPSRYLNYEGEEIRLILPAGSVVDFEVFRTQLRSAVASRRPDALQEALDLYQGELLPMDRYCEWTDALRTRLAELYLEGLVTLATLYLEQERFTDALDRVHQALHLDPWNEEAVRVGMLTYLRLGSAPYALRLYRRLAEVLNRELGITPRRDLQELAESIQNR
uniref:Bacterial transcriptional activator domain-containing protein n=1 Tax=Anaerolinea thermolimosa TaxID=229919 RepID=A0A7C4PM85_9CHLR